MRAVALVLPWIVLGCLEAPQYACSNDAACVLNNVQGTCDVATNTCLYPSGPDCPSMLRDAHGNCAEPGSNTDDPTADASATESSPATTEPDPTTTDAETTDTSDSPTTSSAADCDADGLEITHRGVVGASSVFDDFPPILSADGDASTSWFSRGPEEGPTVYSWVLSQPTCIARIELVGNALHSNPAFREGFGFEAVTVKLLDASNRIVFMEPHPLVGTPDPDLAVETGGVEASRLLLEFTGHENIDCGGFAELRVFGD